MMANGILEIELIERIYDLWESKACHKCGSEVKSYEDTNSIIKYKDILVSSSNQSYVATSKYIDRSESHFSKRPSDISSIPTAHPEYEK